jgi:hypothetical protein
MKNGQDKKLINRHWRTAFFCLAGLFVVAIILAVYEIIDQAVTIDYMQEGYKSLKSDFAVLRKLTPELHRGMSQKDVLTILRRQNPKAFIVEEKNTVWIGQVVFVFDQNGKLIEIRPP